MSGGDWFVLGLILMEFGAFFAYGWAGTWLTAMMWFCLASSNVFWFLGNTVGK